MEFTKKLFIDFLKKLIAFDKDSCSTIDVASRVVKERDYEEKNEWSKVRSSAEQKAKSYASKADSIVSDFQKQVDGVLSRDFGEKSGIFARLQKCKEQLALVSSAEKSITDNATYLAETGNASVASDISIDDLLQGKVDFVTKAYEVNEILNSSKKKGAAKACSSFYSLCRIAENLLNQEIVSLRSMIVQNRDALHSNYSNVGSESHEQMTANWATANQGLEETAHIFAAQRHSSRQETNKVYSSSSDILRQRLGKLVDGFCRQFPPKELADEYMRIYALEPSYEKYECCGEMPRNVHISSLEYDITPHGLSDYTRSFLSRYYPFMYRGSKISIPYCASFGHEFNYLFRFNGDGRQKVVKDACNLGMRLFMMLPPGKLNFTFIDPVTLGESFAMFTRLVDVDDRTSEVINGKIWSAPADIEEKLKIMTDHISNVTQRCLQGKFDNIYEYNRVAEQNAEAYQVIMLMDFPAGLTDQSLKLLEQIVNSGPKCGVFTIIYRNESQYKKVSERSHPLISNIETSFQKFDYSSNGVNISCSGDTVKDKALLWHGLPLPSQTQMDGIIAILKKGIKNADKVVIGIEKVSDAESTCTTKDGIRIPIGIHGANEVQYLTLGVGGSHHALIAGVAGSGKSSLLHTIILRALTQYSPEELSVYLVDFKRGVEFKIYADFVLPSFKVVAIESEREFGYNILVALEREQKIRADLFKKSHVDKIEEYRELGKKMPRILVIMDEFHELFSNANDEFAKKSAVIMERIVRQGRAFGVHLILASQSYSNITGIDRAVFDQMAVRIVLKCSKADANLLLDNGSSEIDQISIDDPGRAVYNSEAGNKEFNSHFRVAYIDPSKHRGMLQEISDSTRKFADPKQPTRILLSNIEDNNYSIFNQFPNYDAAGYRTPGRLYIGEPLSVTNNMAIDLTRSEYSNLLMIGGDTEKARSMFAFAIMSLCINYWIVNRKAPEMPFITLFNCKPLDDSYFKDTPKLLAEFLPEYVRYVACGDIAEVQTIVSELYEVASGSASAGITDKYFFVFGYQRAEELKSETKLTQSEDIDTLFNIMPSGTNQPKLSPKEMFRIIVKDGAQKGVHTLLWQDSFNALYQDDKDMMSYFSMKVAFDMSPEEYSRFVSANDVSLMSENNAIYYNRARDNQKFRPYQAPDEEWLKTISEKLK
ncbi:FtsK/SpoIIIE domain-containing protein [Agathobacter rectalis]|uniref:FtsK/SpoIIIE domain-containing protein n=1 Tax=Agathobacter rectalis TaxID=39491 RepID=UPI0032BF96B8